MFLKLSSNIVGKLSPNIAIYRLVGTELKRGNKHWTKTCLHCENLNLELKVAFVAVFPLDKFLFSAG